MNMCLNCGKELPLSKSPNLNIKRKYCSYECRQAYARKRYLERNPPILRGKTSATTGAISELRVAVDLLAKGYDVFRALSPSCPCDLAILKDGKLVKMEVRTSFISVSGKPYKTIDHRDDTNNIDIYAWVLPDRIIYEPPLE